VLVKLEPLGGQSGAAFGTNLQVGSANVSATLDIINGGSLTISNPTSVKILDSVDVFGLIDVGSTSSFSVPFSAAQPVTIEAGGEIEASGGTITLSGGSVFNSGTLLALNGGTVELVNDTVTGGQLTVENGGELLIAGGATLDGVIVTDNSAFLAGDV